VDGESEGLFSTAGGVLHAVAFEGDIAPGSGGSGADVTFTSFRGPRVNDSGEMAFYGVTSPNFEGGDFGIYSTSGGTLHAVAFEGDIAPEAEKGVRNLFLAVGPGTG
jgi:hypothetical protein